MLGSKGRKKTLICHIAQNEFGICDLWRILDFLNVLSINLATQQQDVDESPRHAMDGESGAVAVVIQIPARTFRKCYIRNSEQMTNYIFVQYDK